MNKSFVKFVTDFGPLLVFLFFYYNSDKNLKIAIPPFIIATLIALTVVWLIDKKIPMIPLIGGILISLFGGLTIYFDNPIFIYIKPTIINKKRTYLGALEVIANILFGSKDFIITRLYIIKMGELNYFFIAIRSRMLREII